MNSRHENISFVNFLRSARTNATVDFLECLNDGHVDFYFPTLEMIDQINAYRALKVCKILNIKLGKETSLNFSNVETSISSREVFNIISKHKKDLIKFHKEITKAHEINAKNVYEKYKKMDADEVFEIIVNTNADIKSLKKSEIKQFKYFQNNI